MKAYMLYCANNTEARPVELGYSEGQVSKLPLDTQVVDRKVTHDIPDGARSPCIKLGRIALNLGTVSKPDWKLCLLPIKSHAKRLYIETHHVDALCVVKLEEKLKQTVKLHAEIARMNLL